MRKTLETVTDDGRIRCQTFLGRERTQLLHQNALCADLCDPVKGLGAKVKASQATGMDVDRVEQRSGPVLRHDDLEGQRPTPDPLPLSNEGRVEQTQRTSD